MSGPWSLDSYEKGLFCSTYIWRSFPTTKHRFCGRRRIDSGRFRRVFARSRLFRIHDWIAVPGHASRPQILSERQQRELRASFRRTSPEGKRDYAMTLCMLDLGLRGCEVVALRLQDIDWQGRRLHIPATKTGQGRLLPIPRRIFAALRDYVENGRPAAEAFDHVFVRHPRRIGHPLSRSALKAMVSRAYQRCGFPESWSGTHRLRHTFASRLYKRGAQMKSLADFLGHRCLNSTNDYTQVDLQVLRSLAQPWPC
ncbi:MAG: tyrosine-type recombinase/integrase [Terrimicrobiaceae bacterium]